MNMERKQAVSGISDSSEGEFSPFACVAILGVGLIGGSFGMALRRHGLAIQVTGCDRSRETLASALASGAIDTAETEAIQAVREADLIVVAVPVGSIPRILETIAPHVRPDALVTDLGSTKTRIVETGEALFGNRFVGGHPMAGSEESGIGAARADLFTGAAWALVHSRPVALASDSEATRLADLVTALKARPILLDAARHDRLTALVSHLPHILSFAFAHTIQEDADADAARALAGGSYRDIMRVSAADPRLWQDIFQENREALLAALDAYEIHLHRLRESLTNDDAEALLACLRNDIASP